MSFDRARRIADAVLLEGYALYPYRASATKNRWRWSFGILAPRAWSEAGGCEAWWLEAQVLVEAGERPARVRGRLRFLRPVRRTVEAADAGGFRPVEALDDGARRLVPWDEGEVREIELPELAVPELGAPGSGLQAPGSGCAVPFEVPDGRSTEDVRDASGTLLGRTVRTSRALSGLVTVGREPAGDGLERLRVRVENVTPWEAPRAPRDEALGASLVAAHLLLEVEDGAFVSLVDPPPAARGAAAACRNVRTFPVLAGAEGERDLVLCAPFILYDHPRIAPESPGDLFDATEIDEILTLRTATLTEEEKREARGTDPRVAALLDRVDHLPPEAMARLHGTLRDVRGGADVPRAAHRPGDRVRLRPGARRTDAQDLLYAGRIATVREVREDVDGRQWLAVTVDDDAAAELHGELGRYHFLHHYATDEVEAVETTGEGRP